MGKKKKQKDFKFYLFFFFNFRDFEYANDNVISSLVNIGSNPGEVKFSF